METRDFDVWRWGMAFVEFHHEGSFIESRIVPRLPQSLKVRFNLTSAPECSEFHQYLVNFFRLLCRDVDHEVLAKATSRIDGKGLWEWQSWYIDEVLCLMAGAIDAFALSVAELNSLPAPGPDRKIPCVDGQMHQHSFADCWRTAVHQRRAAKSIDPKSEKHVHKRNSHTSPPYLSDVFLTFIRR